MKTINNDSGSLKAPNFACQLGDKVAIKGDKVPHRTVTYIMGKGDRQHLCFKGTGPVPEGEVEFELVTEAKPAPAPEAKQ